ncbi:hypothetical protein ACFSJW_22495 [Flavobacterium artemisiae]|uniref:TMhelix containing protein n=1 Tax=Flavobacterium artemisiae TaxID=2126556 RepID=A0ABW4H7M7_9FLAO
MKLYLIKYIAPILGSLYFAASFYQSNHSGCEIKAGISVFLAVSFSLSLYDKIKS